MLILKVSSSKCKGCYSERDDEWPHFCQLCQTQCFESNFANWSSGNSDIDEIIRTSQLDAKRPEELIEWVDFSQFSSIEKLGQGSFGSVYKAARRHANYEVALKICNALSDLLNEVCHLFFLYY